MAAHLGSEHFTTSFNIDDTAVVLIDHQIGTCGWVHSIDAKLLEKNVMILATFAVGMKMPLVLTSSMYFYTPEFYSCNSPKKEPSTTNIYFCYK